MQRKDKQIRLLDISIVLKITNNEYINLSQHKKLQKRILSKGLFGPEGI
jgi:hypothetical protein